MVAKMGLLDPVALYVKAIMVQKYSQAHNFSKDSQD